MRREIVTGLVAATVFGLVGCATPPGSGSSAGTVIPNTQLAQTVGRDQGQATAAETGAASNNVTPIIVNALAAKTVNVKIGKDGQKEVSVEANPDATVTVEGAKFGNVHWGNDATMEASTSSGGGAAGGTGGTARAGTSGSPSTTTTSTSSPRGGGQ